MDDQTPQQSSSTEPPMSGSEPKPEAQQDVVNQTSPSTIAAEPTPSADSAPPVHTATDKKLFPKFAVAIIILVLLAGAVFFSLKTMNGQPKAPEIATDKAQMENTEVQTGENMVQDEGRVMENAADLFSAEEIELEVVGGKFYYKPNELLVKKGQLVQISFKNEDGVHDFVIDEFDVASPQINTGEETDIEFIADKAGQFEFYCSVGNHREMGMTGVLIVME